MLEAPPRVAWTLALAAAVAAGAAAARGVEPLGPWLSWHLSPLATTADMQVFLLKAEARGGETIPIVSLEAVRGDVAIRGRTQFFDLLPDNAALFTISIRRNDPEEPIVRLRQRGHVDRAYDVELAVDRR